LKALNDSLAAGYAAFQRGDLATARAALKPHDHPKALHLLALVEKAGGEFGTARVLLERAAAVDPSDPEIANNLGVLAQQTGDRAAAEAAFRRALSLKPDFVQAATGLGRLLIDSERWQDAEAVYAHLMSFASANVSVRYGFATVELGLGRAEAAEAVFEALIKEGNTAPQIYFMRARTRLQQNRVDEALADLQQAHAQAPSEDTLKTLAGTWWMSGDREHFDALMKSAVENPGLVTVAAEILRQSGQPQAAIDTLTAARKSHALPVQSWIVEATAYTDLDSPREAEQAAREGLVQDPGERILPSCLATALLMQGNATEALQHIEPMREREPDDQHWIAHEATAWRLLGKDEYAKLVDLDRFVRPYTLPVPDGFESLEEFNSAFLDVLKRWHHYDEQPLDQSLRLGTQTPRNLTTIDDPVIEAFIAALDTPIRQYMRDVGNDPDHPLTARNTGEYRIAGSWSVRLKGGGWHVNHVHPDGWISSAYYVSVPAETRAAEGRSGWIKFAEPPFATVPPTPAEKWIQPQAGLLVLFPSFLWHGTEPIHDSSVRVTAPFDVVPA
jgi:tetratricopeptide (TPR) repeat protein